MSRSLPLLAALLLGCGAPNSLGGSVEELFELEISGVEIRRNDEAFQLSYYRNRGADLDLVVRLTVALAGVELLPGGKLDLAGEYAPGHRRTVVIHLPGGEPSRALPGVRQGDLQLEEGGVPGEATRGEFSLGFEQGEGFGAGRTLYGRFSAIAQDG